MALEWRLSSCQNKYACTAGTKTWEKNAIQLVSYQQLCWRGLVFETEVKNNETPIPKKYSIQTHKYQRQCQKIPHKKNKTFSGPVQENL